MRFMYPFNAALNSNPKSYSLGPDIKGCAAKLTKATIYTSASQHVHNCVRPFTPSSSGSICRGVQNQQYGQILFNSCDPWKGPVCGIACGVGG